jgi:2-amino-4-hydroxy-6-hydroxymethyldihydropteridine diphosphokinase/dihydropteroate synthase
MYLSLGSNEGCARKVFSQALEILRVCVGRVLSVSRLYSSPAMYVKDQADFSNIVVCVLTRKDPDEVLKILLSIERQAGRKRVRAKGPRPLDMDILFYGRRRFCRRSLCIPHRYWYERPFVLYPLLEVRKSFRRRESLSVSDGRIRDFVERSSGWSRGTTRTLERCGARGRGGLLKSFCGLCSCGRKRGACQTFV